METVRYFDPRSGSVETEQIYGERWLRLAYEHPAGPAFLHTLLKRRLFSAWFGRRMKRSSSRRLIGPFIEEFGLDPAEFAAPPDSFASFNEFFARRLRPAARPLAATPAVFPCDGRHLGFPDLSAVEAVFAKGQRFDLPALLGSRALAERFAAGSLVLSRLCPVDYHRFHFPADGVPGAPRLLNGPLFSVSPLALRRNLSYLWQNKRVLTEFQTPDFGTVLLLEISATNVGSIRQTFTPHEPVRKGEEKGYFEFGGSSLITLFEPGRLTLREDLLAHSAEQVEFFAPFGARLTA